MNRVFSKPNGNWRRARTLFLARGRKEMPITDSLYTRRKRRKKKTLSREGSLTAKKKELGAGPYRRGTKKKNRRKTSAMTEKTKRGPQRLLISAEKRISVPLHIQKKREDSWRRQKLGNKPKKEF